MAKQKFTIAHDVRIDGKHVRSGSPIELDARDGKDASTLNNLLSSNRIVEVDAAHKHLEEATRTPEAEPAKELPKAELKAEQKAERAEHKGSEK